LPSPFALRITAGTGSTFAFRARTAVAAADADAEEGGCRTAATSAATSFTRTCFAASGAERFVARLLQGQRVLFAGRAFGVEVDFARPGVARHGHAAEGKKCQEGGG
jgi:hypothetical protein